MENESAADAVRETYERAISNIPPSQVCECMISGMGLLRGVHLF